MPVALIALVAFIATIVIWNVVVKRNMAEAMILGFLVTLAFAGFNAPEYAVTAVVDASENQVLYAAVAFVFMTHFVERTGVIDRLIAILSSLFGKLPGGPAIVDTLASGAMGAVAGGSNTGNAASSGSITGPWMVRTGWKRSRAATVIAGNAGLGTALPPSASMVIMIGFAGTLVTTSEVYLALLVAGIYQFVFRMGLIGWFVKRDKITAASGPELLPWRRAMKRGGSSTLIFLGALIPIVISVGPLADFLQATPALSEAMGSISLIVWIPVLIMFFAAIVAWKDLPRSPRGWWELITSGAPKFSTIVALLFFAVVASEVLAELGLAEDVDQLLSGVDIPLWLLVTFIGLLIVLVAGPLSSTATLTAVGQVSLFTLIAAGIDPLLAVIAILVFASTEGASPPASGAIFVASGLTGAKPESTFVPLIIYYVVPFFALGVLIALGIVPVPGG